MLLDVQPSIACSSSRGPTFPGFNKFVISPNYANDQTLFAYNDGGGIWKSTDGGNTWTDLGGCSAGNGFTGCGNGLTNVSITHAALSPNYAQDQTLFVSTDSYRPSAAPYPGSVFESTDGGNNWSEINAGMVNDNNDELACGSGPNHPDDCKVADTVAVSPDFAFDHSVLTSFSMIGGMEDNGIFSYTADSNPVCVIPSLALSENRVYWASLADYDAKV